MFSARMAVKIWVVLGGQGKALPGGKRSARLRVGDTSGGHQWLPSPEGSAGVSHLL